MPLSKLKEVILADLAHYDACLLECPLCFIGKLPNHFMGTRFMGSRFGGFLAISNYLELSRIISKM